MTTEGDDSFNRQLLKEAQSQLDMRDKEVKKLKDRIEGLEAALAQRDLMLRGQAAALNRVLGVL